MGFEPLLAFSRFRKDGMAASKKPAKKDVAKPAAKKIEPPKKAAPPVKKAAVAPKPVTARKGTMKAEASDGEEE